ncbi:hypothetical protein OAH87_07000 [Marinomonas sp.]|nr:hypothetical protein [Marinomonas sp.]MDB4838191.1 hypothetical protein [Marinomonas sp.]
MMKDNKRKASKGGFYGGSIVLLCVLVSACSDNMEVTNGSMTGNNQTHLSDVKAVVTIESPKVGNLLQLRGIAGKGELVTKTEDVCLASSIKLAAGSFNGHSVGIHTGSPIKLSIYSEQVTKRLSEGDEILSDEYRITDQNDTELGDIKIESGLTLDDDFVLNPGEWSWGSVFSTGNKIMECDVLHSNINKA